MGIPIMSDIHTPTVPSASSSTSNKADTPLPELIQKKERLEAELSALGSVLDSHGVTMATGLTTFDGFPRADIDVAQIRTTRARVIHLRNDHKDIMARIEKGLHAHFAAKATNPTPETPPTTTTSIIRSLPFQSTARTQSNGSTTAGPPFAVVNAVTPHSPALEAGLVVGDKIQRFGDATWFNHEKLAKVAQIVGRSEGRVINVTLLRRTLDGEGEDQIEVELTPRSDWGGRGLLGCHLLPL